MTRIQILPLLLLFLIAPALAPGASAQDAIEKPDVTIEVDGLACPFCAYGIEKKLKKVKGVAALEVLIEKGQIRMRLNEGSVVTDEQIRKAVADAGFTVRKIIRATADSDSSGTR